jgi:hypothetical protein
MTSVAFKPLDLTFDPEKHEYRVAGRVIPSSTQILKDCKLFDFDAIPREVGELAMDRGSKLHLALEYLDKGELDETEIDPELVPYIHAYREFCDTRKFEPSLIEYSFYHEGWGYCGTLDRTGTFGESGDRVIIDIKTGEAEVKRPVALQLVSYANKLEQPRLFRRIALRLSRKGKYRVTEFKRVEFERDLNCFRSALNVYNWKRG